MHCGCETWRGMAFSMSNRAENSVSAFLRDRCGALRFLDEWATGGGGTGQAVVDPLASQGALAAGGAGRFLFAVNAGNDTLSSFRLERGRAELAGVAPSGGERPVGVAVCGDLLYALNAGGDAAAGLSGFRVRRDGALHLIPDSARPLSAFAPQPACAVFSPDGRFLVVSERGTDLLAAYPVLTDGRLGDPAITGSSGGAPFGMAFTRRGVLLVSEAGPNALSSYRLEADGALQVVSASVPTHQGATCWVSVTPDGCSAYTSNAATGTLSRYRVAPDGGLTLIESVPTTPAMNGAPLDSAVDPRGDFLYVLNGAQGSVSAFLIECEGHPALIQIYENTGLPGTGAQGMAVV